MTFKEYIVESISWRQYILNNFDIECFIFIENFKEFLNFYLGTLQLLLPTKENIIEIYVL